MVLHLPTVGQAFLESCFSWTKKKPGCCSCRLEKVSLFKNPLAAQPISAEGAKIKVRQFNFELTFSDLICAGKGFISKLTIVRFGDLYGLTWSVLAFLNNCTLKLIIKQRYEYTDSAIMG